MKYTTDDINLKDSVKLIADSDVFDRDLIPEIPVIKYYDSEGNFIFADNTQESFMAFELWVNAHNKIGYYCEIITEWWDDNDEYHGPTGKRNYKKFFFNDGGSGNMSDFPSSIFRFNFECAIEIRKRTVPQNN